MRAMTSSEKESRSESEKAKSSSQESIDKFAHLNGFDTKSPYDDSGNFPHIHYKTKIHPLRFRVRQALLPLIRAETPILSQIQRRLRSPLLDYYFAWTANLAAHTFYVLMLPLPCWFGYGGTTRDLVFLLGYGIYVSGYIKDFCCLPRPRSPPLHRITMSGYTAKEYGFPSSHSANATAVSVYLMFEIWKHRDSFGSTTSLLLASLALLIYYFSLIFGRVYCGMHGLADIIVGSLIGGSLYSLRMWTAESYDRFILEKPVYVVLSVVLFNYALIYFHISPVDDCPCYDDSVAFIGVIMGFELSNWIFVRTDLRSDLMNPLDISMPYSFEQSGVLKSLIRVVIGILLVAIWKEISKPLLLKLFQPVYNLLNRKPDAPTFNRIRSATMDKHETDVTGFVKEMSSRKTRDSVGPQSTIDLTEFEDLKEHKEYFEALDKLQQDNVVFTCGVFKNRYDITIIVRLIVYAGIPFTAMVVFPIVVRSIGL